VHGASHHIQILRSAAGAEESEEETRIALPSVEITSTLLAVLPDRKTGGKDTVRSSSFKYTWNRLKHYHHACCMSRVGFVIKHIKRTVCKSVHTN
jgi:hypothetical protein